MSYVYNYTTDSENKGYMEHLENGLDVTEDIEKFAIEIAFKFSRYIFIQRIGKKQYGYCTHCKSEFLTLDLRHNQKCTCPYCNSLCKAKGVKMGRKYMIDECYFVYYEKSAKEKDTIIARGIYAKRDYRYDYKEPITKYYTEVLYVFRNSESKMIRKEWGKWHKYKKVFKANTIGHLAVISNTSYSYESLLKAVGGTTFMYSGFKEYHKKYPSQDLILYFDVYSKYNMVESLVKIGFQSLIDSKISGEKTYSSINWNGKTITKILKLNKGEIKEFRSMETIDFFTLKLLQICKKDGSKKNTDMIKQLWSEEGNYRHMQSILKYTTLEKMYKYINKQVKLSDRRFQSVLIDWSDYIKDCNELEMNLSDKSILYPKDVNKAHQDTINLIKLKGDEILNKKIERRLEGLNKKYYFESGDFIIRPARSSEELIEEGKALSHCVGRYSKDYANGKTDILFVRNIKDINKSFFTVEVSRNSIFQVRGYKNCEATNKVKNFVEKFKAVKLQSSDKKSA